MGYVLPLCGVQVLLTRLGQVDTSETAMCTTQAMQTARNHPRLFAQSRGSQVERPEAGWLGVWVVADVRLPAGSSGDGQSLVQDSWSRKPFRETCCVKPVEETAVYGPVRTVVWEDGGREAPSYPICGASDPKWGAFILWGKDELAA